jgi:predicted HTH transcriptional regulator
MTEVLFCLSIGFVGYVVYVLVDEQRTPNSGIPEELVLAVEPSKPRTPRNTARAAKTKSAVAELKKAVPEPSLTPDPILTYLGKNGLTTVAKLSRELPESRKMIQDRIDQLIQEGAISLSTVRNAKAVALNT